MAIATPATPSAGTMGINKVSNPDQYLQEMFDQSPDPSLPSFKDFLEQERGISIDTFSENAKETLALIMETTIYSQYCAMHKQMQSTNVADNATDSASDSDRVLQWVDSSSPEDVKKAIEAMEMRTRQLRDAFHVKMATGSSAS